MKSGVFQRYLNYSFEQEVHDQLTGAVPFAS